MAMIQSALRVKDVMTPNPFCVAPSTTIRELAQVFEENEISGAPVVDQQGAVIGIVTKTDLIRRCAEGTGEIPPALLFEMLSEQGDEGAAEVSPEPSICVEDFMTEDPLMVAPDTSAAAVARLMFDKRIHRVIVADDENYPLGMITSLDLLKAYPQPQ